MFLLLLAVWSGTTRTLLVHVGLPSLPLVLLAILLPGLPGSGLPALILGAVVTGFSGLLVLLAWPPLRNDLRWALARLGHRAEPQAPDAET